MPGTITIALDAMGGDRGPDSVLEGANLLLKDYPDVAFLLYGNSAIVSPILQNFPELKNRSGLIHTDKEILGDDKPSAALRNGKGSSMQMAIQAVANGEADAVVSSGNTGALMAMAKMHLKTVPGVHRPAIASAFPSMSGSTIMLDLGANVLVDAENLVQFAVLGSIFAKAYKGIEKPSVGLLNVGSEDVKGPDHVRGAAKILQRVDFPGRYTGFVEGNDIAQGTVDVIVCDGYVGNIALKTAEGFGKFSTTFFRDALRSTFWAKVGSLFAYCALQRFKKKLDPRYYNGGVFLGLNGICVKSHGGSDALAFSSALSMAIKLAQQGYKDVVSRDIGSVISQEGFVTRD